MIQLREVDRRGERSPKRAPCPRAGRSTEMDIKKAPENCCNLPPMWTTHPEDGRNRSKPTIGRYGTLCQPTRRKTRPSRYTQPARGRRGLDHRHEPAQVELLAAKAAGRGGRGAAAAAPLKELGRASRAWAGPVQR